MEGVNEMKNIGLIIFLGCVAFAVACTSSNTATTNIQTNSQWDQQYRQESRSAQSQQRTEQGADIPREDPPITIMLLSMETGDVFPGEDYYVYAVVDNPDNRDLEYVWSVADGDVSEVPESERGRLSTLLEEEYATASAIPPPATEQPAPPAEGEQLPAEGAFQQPTEPGATQPPPGAGQPQQPTGGTRTQPGTQPQVTETTPEGAQLPGEQATGTEEPYQPLGPTGGGAGTGTYSSGGTQPTGGAEQQPADQQPIDQQQPTDQSFDRPAPPAAVNPADQSRVDELWNQILDIEDQIRLLTDEKFEAEMSGDQVRVDDLQLQIDDMSRSREPLQEELNRLIGKGARDTASLPQSRMLGYVLERRVVSGANGDEEEEEEEDDSSENVELLAAQLAEGVTAVGADIADTGEEALEGTAGNVAQAEAASESSSWIGESLDLGPSRPSSLRTQYEVWKEDSDEPRRRNLGGYGDLDETEPLLVEESYDVHTFVTSEPYIQWTPRLPGLVNIYVKATYKDEEVTEPRELQVEVRLRDAEVKISEEFPDVVREDEPLYVMLEGSNIPAFYKGLFTLTFDPNMLSFREAELGEYFDDATDASLFYAEPDKMAGKVLLAVDSNLKVGELGGNGPLVYVMFKAKQDLIDRSDTQLAMVMDTAARYILTRDGENILPLPVESAPFRTETIMPPDLSQYQLQERPGTGGGQVPALGQQQLPQQQPTQQQLPQQQRQPTGGTYIPPSGTGTYIPPSGTGGTQQPTGGTTPQETQGPSLGQAGGQGTGIEAPTGGGGGTGTGQDQQSGNGNAVPEQPQPPDYPDDPQLQSPVGSVSLDEDETAGDATTEEETATTEGEQEAEEEADADEDAQADSDSEEQEDSSEPEPEPEADGSEES